MSGTDADVVAAAFGTETVNAINSILDTLPQGDRIETPDINNIFIFSLTISIGGE